MSLRSLLLALLSLLIAPTAAARGGMPTPLTERGAVIEDIYFQIFVAGTIVFLFVMAWLIYSIWRFRADGGVGRETFEIERENLKLEMAWIGIPLIVVLWVGAISYAGLVELDEGFGQEEPYMELNITGYQWTWLADYGSDVKIFSDPSPVDGSVADENVFKIPANVPIRLNVTAGDVIHAYHIMDANWATVGLVDANPSGPHKYNLMTIEFPMGEYNVQCREMCFNPGHGYMRARMEAVSMAEFGEWMEDQKLASGAQFTQDIGLEIDDAGNFVAPEDLVLAKGARAVVTLTNNDDQARTIAAPPFEFRTVEFNAADATVSESTDASITLAAGSSESFTFEVSQTGDFAFATGSDSAPFSVTEAVPLNVELGDLFIRPDTMELEAGTTYLFNIRNIGAIGHNFFIGTKSSSDSQETLLASATIGAGATTSLLWTPEEDMRFDTWCNVPGHWPPMKGTLTVVS